jgi:sulfite reductase alpha subunit-like flavoprotein
LKIADNSKSFFEWLQATTKSDELSGVTFAVFGLGDSTYKHYNVMGLQCDGAPLISTLDRCRQRDS